MIPTWIKNTPIYKRLDGRSEIITIYVDRNLYAAGLAGPVKGGVGHIIINPNRQKDYDDLVNTIFHELNHIDQNIKTGNRLLGTPKDREKREFIDTYIILPGVIRKNTTCFL